MNPIGADQHVAVRGRTLRAVTIEEIRGHAAFVLAKRAEPMSGMDARLAKPGAHRLPDHRLQPAAVDGELRDVIARIGPAQLAPDLLAEPVGVDQLAGPHRDRVELPQQPELGELRDRMRQHVDPDPELADHRRRLVDLAADAPRIQHQPERQPTDSTADHDDVHGAVMRQPRRAVQPAAICRTDAAIACFAWPSSQARCGRRARPRGR